MKPLSAKMYFIKSINHQEKESSRNFMFLYLQFLFCVVTRLFWYVLVRVRHKNHLVRVRKSLKYMCLSKQHSWKCLEDDLNDANVNVSAFYRNWQLVVVGFKSHCGD